MKKIALISSYCDSIEKLEILNTNIRILKNLEIDTFVISPIKIDVDSDYLFITKENPVLRWPERSIAIWNRKPYQDKFIKKVTYTDDYGWASLYQIKKIMDFAVTYDYDIFYFLIYDLNIDEKIIDDIKSNIKNITYPRKNFNNNSQYPASLHFSIFDKEKLKIMSELICKETYLKSGFAENFIDKCASAMGMSYSTNLVTDLICVTEPEKIFNQSKSKNYGLFFNKDENTTFKLFLFDFKETISVQINEKVYEITQDDSFLDTELKYDEIQKIIIQSHWEIIDYTDHYNNIVKSSIYFD